MLSQLLSYIHGYLLIRVHGNSAERFLNACRYRGIHLWGLQASNGSYEMYISIRDFKKLKPVIRKTGTKVGIVKKFGLPFWLYRNRKRKMFFTGAVLCFFLLIWMSGFIWSIDISGNQSRTDDTLIKFLKTKSVQNGMKKSKVDCSRIVKDIRKEYDDVIWVSASIKGTKLIIQLKENEDSEVIQSEKSDKEDTNKDIAMDIVADRDCVIETITIRNGVLKVKPGSKVKKGEVLVSGQVPVNNDAGETISYQNHVSDADIIGKASLKYSDSISNTYVKKNTLDIYKEEYFLKLEDMQIALGGIKNEYENFKMYGNQKQIKLFDHLSISVFYGIRKVVPYKKEVKPYTEKEIRELLTVRFLRSCRNLRKKGVEIIGNDVKIYTGSEKSTARGTMKVKMPVGKVRPSKIIHISENMISEDGS